MTCLIAQPLGLPNLQDESSSQEKNTTARKLHEDHFCESNKYAPIPSIFTHYPLISTLPSPHPFAFPARQTATVHNSQSIDSLPLQSSLSFPAPPSHLNSPTRTSRQECCVRSAESDGKIGWQRDGIQQRTVGDGWRPCCFCGGCQCPLPRPPPRFDFT